MNFKQEKIFHKIEHGTKSGDIVKKRRLPTGVSSFFLFNPCRMDPGELRQPCPSAFALLFQMLSVYLENFSHMTQQGQKQKRSWRS
jgi:hypothetical protein